MRQPATPVFEFISAVAVVDVRCIEVASPAFLSFRRCVRRLIELLSEDAEDAQQADRLQLALLQWLSVPVPFSEYDLTPISDLGARSAIRTRWGAEALDLFITASSAMAELLAAPNPLRESLNDELLNAAAEHDSILIYCHRTARAHFESLPGWADANELAKIGFIGSPRDYRSAEPCDALLKVGPLRSRGFSSVPASILNAPRFTHLVQIVWQGTPDEPGFGDDPVLRAVRSADHADVPTLQMTLASVDGIIVKRNSEVFGDKAPRILANAPRGELVDDFAPERRVARAADGRRALLFHLGDGLACLQAPHADIICVGREGAEAVVERPEPREIDARFTHLVDPNLDNVDFGALRVAREEYAPKWKARLAEEYRRSPEQLTQTLLTRGIELDTLEWRLSDWIKPSTTVIHAPKSYRHFKILMDVLRMGVDDNGAWNNRKIDWAVAAWAEVTRTRGKAIQHGAERHEIIAEELVTLLRNDWSLLAEKVTLGQSVKLPLPPGRTLSGVVHLHAIIEIEEGYRCPDSELGEIFPLERLLQWRE